jgi:hypothetical protein
MHHYNRLVVQLPLTIHLAPWLLEKSLVQLEDYVALKE